GLAARGVAGPNTGRQCELRGVGICHGFIRAFDDLNRENGAERFFLEQAHCGVDTGYNSGLEEVRAEIGPCFASPPNLCAGLYGIGERVVHALYVLWANEWADVGGRVGAPTEAELFGLFHAKVDELFGGCFFHEKTLYGQTDLAAVRVRAPYG